jgi:Zn-dependent protease with chaperone function
MAENFPSDYVDPATGDVRRLGSLWDKMESETLPKTASFALIAGKALLLAPLLGVAAVAVPGVTWLASKLHYRGLFNDVYEEGLAQTRIMGEQYNLGKPIGRDMFNEHFGHLQPTFADDYVRMVATAGLKEVPKIVVREDVGYLWGRIGRNQDDYNAGAISRTDGGKPSIEIGQGVLEQMTPGELRAIIGHEITHLALGHTHDLMRWKALKPVNAILNVALVGAAVFGFAPLLPALALVGVSILANRCLESVESRRREELCDRGAALLTGGTADLAAGLRKLKIINRKIVEEEVANRNAWSVVLGGHKVKIKEESALHRFMYASHPTDEHRASLLKAFEDKYHGYCEKQRSSFHEAFTRRARKAAPAPQPDLGTYDALDQLLNMARSHKGHVVVLKPGYGHGY